jgi:hypothetical protein
VFEIRRDFTEAHSVSIYIAGDILMIRHYCREFCMEGLCVTVTPTDFVFTGGMETGAQIGLVNYPRFPSTTEHIDATAENLTRFLIERLHQHSALIDGPEGTTWLTRRAE